MSSLFYFFCFLILGGVFLGGVTPIRDCLMVSVRQVNLNCDSPNHHFLYVSLSLIGSCNVTRDSCIYVFLTFVSSRFGLELAHILAQNVNAVKNEYSAVFAQSPYVWSSVVVLEAWLVQ